MLLNSKYNNFNFRFHPDFVSKQIDEKYKQFISRLSVPFDRVIDFLNWSIQSISWPEIQIQTVEQVGKYYTKNYQNGFRSPKMYSQEITVDFKATESFLNYFIIQDIVMQYLDESDKREYRTKFPDFEINLFDYDGNQLLTYRFCDIHVSNLTALELSYSTNNPEFKTFSLTFKYDTLSIDTNFD